MIRRAAALGLLVSLSAFATEPAARPSPRTSHSGPASSRAIGIGIPRERGILDAKNGILHELEESGFKSWDEWSASLEPFRKELRTKVSSAKPNNPQSTRYPESRTEVIEARGEPPIVDPWPSNYLRYLFDPAVVSTSQFMSESAFVSSLGAISRWLASKQIDFILVPVPKSTEVYPDRYIDATPTDRIVAPHMRRAFFELLDRGVEVVDPLPTMLVSRRKAGPLLYQHCDPHWTPDGQRVALDLIVERLRRYPVVRKAILGPPLYKAQTNRMDVSPYSAAFEALTEAQQAKVKPLLYHDIETAIPLTDTKLTSETSPILLAGDSFANGIVSRLAHRINLPVRDVHAAGGTIEPFKDLLREPESMKSLKVVIFLISNPGLYRFPSKLPGEIAGFAADPPAK